jgi:hypothetical protein
MKNLLIIFLVFIYGAVDAQQLSGIKNQNTTPQRGSFFLYGGPFIMRDIPIATALTDYFMTVNATGNIRRQTGSFQAMANGGVTTTQAVGPLDGITIGKSSPSLGILIDMTGTTATTSFREYKIRSDNTGGYFSGMYYGALFNAQRLTYGYIAGLDSSLSSSYATTSIRLYPSKNVVIGNTSEVNMGGILQVAGHITPTVNSAYTLGNSTLRWRSVSADTMLLGNPSFSTAKHNINGTVRFDLAGGNDTKWVTYYRDSATGNFIALPTGSFRQVFMADVGGKPHWDSFIASDIPALDATKIATGTIPISRGGTGLAALGSPLQQIRVNAGATAFEYFTPSAGATSTLDAVTAAGNTTTNSITIGGIVNNGNLNNTGSIRTAIRTASDGSTLLNSDHTVVGNTSGGNCTVTLPTGGTVNGIIYYLSNSSRTNVFTIQVSGSDVISYNSPTTVTSLVIPNAAIVQLFGTVWTVYSLY